MVCPEKHDYIDKYINMIATKNDKILKIIMSLTIVVIAAALIIFTQAAAVTAIEGETPTDSHITSKGVAGGASCLQFRP